MPFTPEQQSQIEAGFTEILRLLKEKKVSSLAAIAVLDDGRSIVQSTGYDQGTILQMCGTLKIVSDQVSMMANQILFVLPMQAAAARQQQAQQDAALTNTGKPTGKLSGKPNVNFKPPEQ